MRCATARGMEDARRHTGRVTVNRPLHCMLGIARLAGWGTWRLYGNGHRGDRDGR